MKPEQVTKVTVCPKCQETNFGDRWSRPGRVLQQYCLNPECSWEGPIRIPEPKEIISTKKVNVNQFVGYYYEIFDRYGYIITSSRTFDSEKDALISMENELKNGLKPKDVAGPYTAVLWPETVFVHGKRFVMNNDTMTELNSN